MNIASLLKQLLSKAVGLEVTARLCGGLKKIQLVIGHWLLAIGHSESSNSQWPIANRQLLPIILGLLICHETLLADESLPPVRHVLVPVNQPQLWPKGDWVPLPFEEYEELFQTTRQQRVQRQDAHIEWQSLSATFDPNRSVLTDGRWTAEVRGAKAGQRLMSLEPLDLAISELRWSDGEAVWGTASDGESKLLVDAPARKLEGRFSCKGRKLPRTWQFDLWMTAASVTEIKLRVPSKYSLKSSVGHLRGPLATGEEGWRLWQINLSGQSNCEVLVVDAPAGVPTEPIIVYEQTSSYVLHEAEVEIQHDVQAEIFHTPKTALTFSVPDDLTIYSVGFAADSRLNWHELPRTPGQSRQIEVLLPEPQIGKVRTIQLLAGATAKWEPTWSLPRIQLTGGWFAGGSWNVAVDAPLVWRAIQTNGLRLTAVNASVPEIRRLSFVQYLADASLQLDISYPESRLTSRGLLNLVSAESEWLLSAEWHWQSASGVSFSARCRVPPGWEILDVQSTSGTSLSGVRNWNVVNEAAGDRVLLIEFVQPLEPGTTQGVLVEARRTRSSESDREQFELPTPLGSQNTDYVLAVAVPSEWRWDASESGIPAPMAMKQMTDSWTSFDLWKRQSSTWNDSTLMVRMKSPEGNWKPKAEFRQAREARITDPLNKVLPTPSTPISSAEDVADQTLVWSTAELRSLIFPGSDGHDRHWLTLKPPVPTRVGRLEFRLPSHAELVSVRMNGVRTEPQKEVDRFRLPSIPQGGLSSLEIQYRIPSDRSFLRSRQSVPVPQVDGPILGFRWLFALPAESRLSEEPHGLRLINPIDPTPWSRRLFGPLGRDSTSHWFNPLSYADWNELWTPITANSDLSLGSEESFAPMGWRIREAVGPTMPTVVTWVAWNAEQVHILAWVGMLFSVTMGCVLRTRRARPRVKIAALWLGLCGAGVGLTAPVAAEILGGCLIGTLIAVLVPRRVMMSYSARQQAVARGAFDKTVFIQGVTGMFLIWCLSSWPASAQESKTSQTVAAREDVLIPVDDPVRTPTGEIRPSDKSPWVYVSKALWQQWRALRQNQSQPIILLTSAKYRVETDAQSTSVNATFLVYRSRPDQPATVRWPFVSVPLAGMNACSLDGKPHPIAMSPNRDSLVLEIPAVEPAKLEGTQNKFASHRVEFALLPTRPVEVGQVRCQLPIPKILQSELAIKSASVNPWQVLNSQGESLLDGSTGQWTAQLGKVKELSVEEPSSGPANLRAGTEATIDVACLAELLPTVLRQRYRARYSVNSGELNEVTWLLPRGVLIRDGDVDADNLLQWTVESLADGRQKVVIEFAKPQTGEFMVDLAALQPAVGTPEVPRWQPWQLDAATDAVVPGAPKVRQRSFVLGVTSLTGFKVAPLATSVESALPGAETAFAKAWGTASIPRQPQAVLSLSTSKELSFRVTPILPQRKVRQELLLKVGRQTIEWELHAEVTTASTPAFQHDILLNPFFRVNKISVTEDEAERLVSWAHKDQRLSIFLRAETTGIQNISLLGRDAIPADGRLTIPTHWFESADASEFEMRVIHDPSWQAEVLNELNQPLSPAESGGPTQDRQEMILGKFRAEPSLTSLQLQLRPQTSTSKAEAWTVISPASDDNVTLTHIEHFQNVQATTINMLLTSDWARLGIVRLSPSLQELARRPTADGIELTLGTIAKNDSPRVVAIEIPRIDAGLNTWLITPPMPVDWSNREHHWLVNNELLTWLDSDSEVLGIDSDTRVDATIRRWLPPNSTEWLTLSPAPSQLGLRRTEIPSIKPSPKTLWMETVIWVVDGAVTRGSTSMLIQSNGLSELRMRRPKAIRWLAAIAEDRPRRLDESAVELVVDDLPKTSVLWVSLFWEIDKTQKDRIVARRDTELPMPVEPALQPARHDVSLLSAGHSDLSSTRGARRISDWEGRLSRASHLLQGLNLAANAQSDSDLHCWNLVQQEIELTNRAVAELSAEFGANQAARDMLKTVNADAELFAANRAQSPAQSEPKQTTELWTSDYFSGIPNPWKATRELNSDATLSVILIDRHWMFWLFTLLAVIALVPIVRGWLLWETGEWLAAHPQVAYIASGVIWWLWLTPSSCGFVLFAFGIMTLLHAQWRRQASMTLSALKQPEGESN